MSRFGYFPYDRESYLHHIWDFPLHARLYDQRFGQAMAADLEADSLFHRFYLRPRRLFREGEPPDTGVSENRSTAERFQVALDVAQFAPDEISVKTVDSYVVVHARHDERPDDHGFVAREFTRRYLLPEGVDPEAVTSALSRDGILVVEGPKRRPEPPKANERVIPIVQLEEPGPSGQQSPGT